jgi:hypothetical protein
MQTVDRDRTSSGRIRSEGDLFLNGGEEWVACALEPAGDQTPWDFEVQDWYHFSVVAALGRYCPLGVMWRGEQAIGLSFGWCKR